MLKKVLIVAAVAVLLVSNISGQDAKAYTWKAGTSNTYYSTGYQYSTGGSYSYRDNNTTTTSELKYGSVGAEVAAVQGYLKNLGYNLGTENGKYGYYTLKAVLDFQRKNGLTANGRVDARTLNLLKSAGSTVEQPTTPTPTPTPTDPTPTPPSPGQVQGLTVEEQQMLNLVNSERVKNGLAPLQVDMEMTRLARMKSQDMIDKNYFSHTSPTYGSPFTMLRNAGITYRSAGENLAGAGSVSRAHTNLMNSSGHRANILNSSFTHVGIGIVKGGPYGMMFTQLFVGR